MKNSSRGLFLWTALFILVGALETTWWHALQPIENRVSDFFVRQLSRQLSTDPEIIIVNIDDASLARMEGEVGSWPWPRAVHGDLINGISKQHPKAIVFDLNFVESDLYRPESDALFNAALAGKKHVYFPLIRLPEIQDAAGPKIADIADKIGIIRSDAADANAHIALQPPLAIKPEHWRVGTVNFLNDSDGVGRQYHLFTDVNGWLVPSLPARLAMDLGYPVPQQADLMLNWRGGLKPFKRISYADLYDDFNRQTPLRPRDEFKDKIVIIGTDASSLHDIRVTPIDSLYGGLDILGTAIDNLKNQRITRIAPNWVPAAFGTVLLLVLSFCFWLRKQALWIGAGLLVVSIAGLIASDAALSRLLLLYLFTPMMLAWTFYFSLALREYLRERKSNQETIQLFSGMVNPLVVKELIASGGVSRAGESREITVLFSDIRGFTTLSEKRQPQEIVTLLNRYFSLQVEVILRHGGSLDKFIGDCIMAFWGAPLDDPNHAINAVNAALEMTQALEKFKQEISLGDIDFDVGIGIHSGPAVVGLIGSEKKREYTAIGDTVNLASRIEGLTKGVSRILVSKETAALCRHELDFQLTGSYKIKGREQEEELFAPVQGVTK